MDDEKIKNKRKTGILLSSSNHELPLSLAHAEYLISFPPLYIFPESPPTFN